MGVCDQHSIDAPQSILWEPLNSGCLEVFANVDNDSPGVQPLLKSTLGRCSGRTNLFFPSFPSIRITVEVFLLTFFLPSGVKVDRHVLQGVSLSCAVRQDTFGKLPDVPVPKKMNSIPGVGCTRSGEWSESGMENLKKLQTRKRFINLQGTTSMANIETPPKR
jgi:hypothetical protein